MPRARSWIRPECTLHSDCRDLGCVFWNDIAAVAHQLNGICKYPHKHHHQQLPPILQIGTHTTSQHTVFLHFVLQYDVVRFSKQSQQK